VGFFCFGINEDDLDVIGKSPFNVLMPYSSMNMGLKNGKHKPGTIDGIREVLDACHAKNIKVAFSLKDCLAASWPESAKVKEWNGLRGHDEIVTKAVEAFREHPALLGWYIADELPPSSTPALRARRALINRLDPWHPTWAVYCVPQDIPDMVGTADLIGMDPYPFLRGGGSVGFSAADWPHNIKKTSDFMEAVRKTRSTGQGVLTWCVPQMFNGVWEKMSREDYVKKSLDPSEVEMRAQFLLMAVYGCRGFIAYNYHHFRMPLAEPDFPRRWPEICRVGQLMKDLAPYLLSTQEEDVPVAAESGVVRARLFRGEAGGARVLVVGEGPGKTRARLTLPAGAVSKSRYGVTKPADGGTWTFEGDNVCCDVLE